MNIGVLCSAISAETWFGILFVTLVSVSPPQLKTTVLGIFLFLMNTSGGNLPVLVHPISKLVGYRSVVVQTGDNLVVPDYNPVECILLIANSTLKMNTDLGGPLLY